MNNKQNQFQTGKGYESEKLHNVRPRNTFLTKVHDIACDMEIDRVQSLVSCELAGAIIRFSLCSPTFALNENGEKKKKKKEDRFFQNYLNPRCLEEQQYFTFHLNLDE